MGVGVVMGVRFEIVFERRKGCTVRKYDRIWQSKTVTD